MLETPDLPHQHTVDTPGRYEVHVDAATGTRSVVWLDGVPGARMERFRSPGPLQWWTVVDVTRAGQVVGLECDDPDARLLVRPEPGPEGPVEPLPTYGIGVGIAR